MHTHYTILNKFSHFKLIMYSTFTNMKKKIIKVIIEIVNKTIEIK